MMAAVAASMLACASTPSYRSMLDDYRAAMSSSEARASDDHALASSALTRDAYVHAVLDGNPSTESARAAWRAALAHVRSAGLLEDPMVTFSVAPLSIGATNVDFGFEAAISQKFPWPGKLSADVSVAKAEAQAAKGDFETTRLDLALSAAQLWDAYFVAARALEVNAKHVALLRELKDAANGQLAAGRGSAQDALEAEMELAHLEHDAVAVTTNRDVLVAQMNELLHREPSSALPPAADLPNEARSSGRDARRPEIEAARLHARAEEERARRARRDFIPDLTIMTSYNSMWTTPEHRWMIGIGLEIPLQVGRRAGAIDEAEANRTRYENEARRLADKVATEIAVGGKRVLEAEHVLRLYETRLMPVARDEVDAARAGFITSRNDFAAVINAEKNLRAVELGRETARADLDRRRAELDRARGRVPGGAP